MAWTIVLIAFAVILLIDLLIRSTVIVAALPIVERRITLPDNPYLPDPIAESVSIPTSDGLVLAGSLYQHDNQPARGLVLFCPEMGGNHWSAMSFVQGAWDAGFDILSFDFRGQGESPTSNHYDPLHWVTDFEVTDVNSAIDYINSREDLSSLPLMMMGVSRGGGAALLAASQHPQVQGVIAEGAFTNQELMLQFGYNWAGRYLPKVIIQLVPQWHIQITLNLVYWVSGKRRNCRYSRFRKALPLLVSRPVLLISGSRDTQVPPVVAEVLQQQIGGEKCSIWSVRGAKHNRARQMDPTLYDQKVGEFFSSLVPEVVPPLPATPPTPLVPFSEG